MAREQFLAPAGNPNRVYNSPLIKFYRPNMGCQSDYWNTGLDEERADLN
jgi:hypothetical protein